MQILTAKCVCHSCTECFISHKLDSAGLLMLSSTSLNERIQWDEMLFIIIKGMGIQSSDSQNGISSYFKITPHERNSEN